MSDPGAEYGDGQQLCPSCGWAFLDEATRSVVARLRGRVDELQEGHRLLLMAATDVEAERDRAVQDLEAMTLQRDLHKSERAKNCAWAERLRADLEAANAERDEWAAKAHLAAAWCGKNTIRAQDAEAERDAAQAELDAAALREARGRET